MFLVGLTGGIATGKSTVSNIIKELGVPVVDADVIARQIVELDKPAYKKIRKSFGPDVFHENGKINRAKLGTVVFTDLEKRRLINRITHPYIYAEIRKQVFQFFLKGEQFVVLDLPLLYEGQKALSYLYKTIVVSCNEDLQIERLLSRNDYSRSEAIDRINAQMPLCEKTDQADFVIENSGSMQSTRTQVEDIFKLLRASKRHLWNRYFYGGILLLIVVLIILGLFCLMRIIF